MGWKPHKPTLVCDLDGVLFSYEKGFQGHDVFGRPIPGAAETLRRLKRDGWYIVIFTTRPLTPKLKAALATRRIPFDDVNMARSLRAGKWRHNPPVASMKPYADAYIDDRDWRALGRPFDRKVWARVYRRLSAWKRRLDSGKILY